MALLYSIHNRTPTCGLPDQEQKRLALSGENRRWWLDTTRRILEAAQERGVDVKQVFAERVAVSGDVLVRLCLKIILEVLNHSLRAVGFLMH